MRAHSIGTRAGLLAIVTIVTLFFTSNTVFARTCYVDSSEGSDTAGFGTSASPYKSITHALRNCETRGDVIRVEPGAVYDEANGERFPITMSPGVDLVGMVIPIVNGVIRPIIRGAALFEIPDATRFVTLLCSDESTISGFVFDLTNSDLPAEEGMARQKDGTAILCDADSFIVERNLFRGDGHSGVTTLGRTRSIIRDNEFRGDITWGITTYENSEPRVVENRFRGYNGLDVSNTSRPIIARNSFLAGSAGEGAGVSTKNASEATVTDNTISGYNYGVIVRMESRPIIQENRITENNAGVYIEGGRAAPNPDIGGGVSRGGNVFDSNEWDVENRSSRDILARNNRWSHGPCCEFIDANDIYDNEENASSGAVDFEPCDPCSVRPPTPVITDRPRPTTTSPGLLRSLGLIDCLPCPHCLGKPCDPRVNPDFDQFLIWDVPSETAVSFSKSKLGLDKIDGRMQAAARVSGGKRAIYVATVPLADSKRKNTGTVLFFNEAGKVLKRVEGKKQGERLGMDMDVRGSRVAVASSHRLIVTDRTRTVFEIKLVKTLAASRGVRVAFTEDIDGDKSPEVLLGAPFADVGQLKEAGLIQVIASDSGKVIDTIYGRIQQQHLGAFLQGVDIQSLKGKAR